MMRMRWAASSLAFALLATACGGGGGGGGGQTAAAVCDGKVNGPVTITVWNHAGQGAEKDTLESQIKEFNETNQLGITVSVKFLTEGTYNDAVQAATAAGDLPDGLDFDGPFLYNYAWSGNLVPIDSCVPDALRNDLLRSIVQQGTYAGHLYSVGTFDSGLAIYAWRSVLEENGIRIPSGPEDAWTADEFDQILATLQEAGYEHPLDIKWFYGGGTTAEWYTYGFSPAIQSAGADLINRSDYREATGVLDSDEAVSVMQRFQGWAKAGYLDLDAKDDSPFLKKQDPLSWVGHWMYPTYKEAQGEDLVIVPLPNLGQGSRTGMGSWNWGITTNAKEPDAVWAFYDFLLTPEQVLKMTGANGAVPATRSAIAQSDLFGPGGDLELYVAQLEEGVAVPRPQTPAYPTITSAFSTAFANIVQGADARAELTKAAQTIDQDLQDNDFYPPPGS